MAIKQEILDALNVVQADSDDRDTKVTDASTKDGLALAADAAANNSHKAVQDALGKLSTDKAALIALIQNSF